MESISWTWARERLQDGRLDQGLRTSNIMSDWLLHRILRLNTYLMENKHNVERYEL
jgi:hypothetical protein